MTTPEKRFENKVKDWLTDQGAWFVKYFANRNTKAGVPDILACLNGHFIGIEVKSQSGRPSKLQLVNCDKITQAGGLAVVLYPSGFDEFKALILGGCYTTDKVIFK